MKFAWTLISALLLSTPVWAKLPAPSDEAKAKAAEAAAKTAHGNKVADFQLCKSREKVAAHYFKTNKDKTAKAPGKPTTPPVSTPACADPGVFVYVPAPPVTAAAPAAPAAAATPAAPAVPAAAPAPAKKS